VGGDARMLKIAGEEGKDNVPVDLTKHLMPLIEGKRKGVGCGTKGHKMKKRRKPIDREKVQSKEWGA